MPISIPLLQLQIEGFKKTCLACGRDNLGLTEVLTLPIYKSGDSEQRFAHLAQIVCGDCGHVLLFDAAKLGLTERDFG